MNLSNILRLNQNYEYIGTLEELENNILVLEDIKSEMTADKQYQFSANRSFGIMIPWGIPKMAQSINVTADIEQQEINKQCISFSTTIRFEHFFIALGFVFSIVVLGARKESAIKYVFVFVLWIIVHTWFQFVYRFQESALIEAVAKQLQLKQVK